MKKKTWLFSKFYGNINLQINEVFKKIKVNSKIAAYWINYWKSNKENLELWLLICKCSFTVIISAFSKETKDARDNWMLSSKHWKNKTVNQEFKMQQSYPSKIKEILT